MSDEDDDDLNFKPGTEISSSKATYVVSKLLGEGGFGAVYRVKDVKTEKQYAMKVERKLEKRKHSKLKMEIAILKLIGNGKHFTQIVDRGKKDKEGYFFLVMELVGKSLADLKLERDLKVFSFTTGLGVAQQCLEACEALHKHGFIHRDLKPQNYACGLEKQKHLIYILDFGIARKFLNTKNELKTPRESVGFKGTVRFAPLACHKGTEMGPKDDCESWFYLLLDLILTQGLPWRKISDKNDVLKCKEECRKDKREAMLSGLPHTTELNRILDYIDKQQYHDRVDYDYIYKMLEEACISSGGKIDAPYDWELEGDTK
ncbi:unnamed protein product [Caenorhabditis angaria]|uniref:Protein kinase domain-containing protein n=1 Tax=Caenorhabditis angaria TaxID=860376 RepID=A0A9P1MY97_9PELO|nr:unnamed protein product [Caenorhabditis angaria]